MRRDSNSPDLETYKRSQKGKGNAETLEMRFCPFERRSFVGVKYFLQYVYFSLIIHEENTREVNTREVNTETYFANISIG